MEPEHDGAGEKSVDEPFRHCDARERRKDARDAHTDVRISEKVRPKHRERPRRHDIRKDEYERNKFFVFEIRSRNEPRDRSAEKNRDDGRDDRHENRIQQRTVKIINGIFAACEQSLPVVRRERADRLAYELHFHRVNAVGFQYERKQRIQRQRCEQNEKYDKDDICRVLQKRLNAIRRFF